MPVNLLWVGESALARECSQLSLTYKKVSMTQTSQGSWRVFFVALGKSPPKTHISIALQCQTQESNDLQYLQLMRYWYWIHEFQSNYNARPGIYFLNDIQNICKSYWNIQQLSPIWFLLDQMSQLTYLLVDPCSWSHYKQVHHLDNSSLHFLNISRFSMSQCSKKGPISARNLTKNKCQHYLQFWQTLWSRVK